MVRKIAVRFVVTILAIGTWLCVGLLAEADTKAEPSDHVVSRAVECTAALEIMSLAAPDWAAQEPVQIAQRFWRRAAIAVTMRTGRDPEREVGNEIDFIVGHTANAPEYLATLAADCVVDATPKGTTIDTWRAT